MEASAALVLKNSLVVFVQESSSTIVLSRPFYWLRVRSGTPSMHNDPVPSKQYRRLSQPL